MRKSTLILTFSITLFACAADQSVGSEAEQIIQRYLKMPHPKGDKSAEARLERLQTLAELKAMPKEAVSAIGRALPEVKDPRQSAELAEVLGRHLQTKESAALLCELLNDPDKKVRWQAIHGLSGMAKRTGRSGAKRVIRGPDFAPKVEGLVPYLGTLTKPNN